PDVHSGGKDIVLPNEAVTSPASPDVSAPVDPTTISPGVKPDDTFAKGFAKPGPWDNNLFDSDAKPKTPWDNVKFGAQSETAVGPEKVSITFNNGKGGIQGLLDFKAELRAKYPDISKLPQGLQDFLNDTSRAGNLKKAMELGFFQPGQDAESALIREGSTLRFDAEQGRIIFHDAATGKDTEKFVGKMFDYDRSGAPKASMAGVSASEAMTTGRVQTPALSSLDHLPGEKMPVGEIPQTPSAEELSEQIRNQIDQSNKQATYHHPEESRTAGRVNRYGAGEHLTDQQRLAIADAQRAGATYRGYNQPYATGQGVFFPELNQQENLILQSHPEFAKNPFNLDGKSLIAAYEVNQHKIDTLFPSEGSRNVWETS
ncbi:MAG: hypothetical protein WD991_01795, partial [Candidatus Paceibacterota bacterium]